MSKHKQRRARRAEYYRMLDAELDQEQPFVNRVLGTLNRDGIDTGPDGRPIKADFWRYMKSRRQTAVQTARAGLCLMERAINSIRVSNP
jgi:hypothetical protein